MFIGKRHRSSAVWISTGVLVLAVFGCHKGLRDPKAPVKEDLLAAFPQQPPRVGEPAPDFTATNLEGRQRRLSEFLAQGPVVLDFANYT